MKHYSFSVSSRRSSSISNMDIYAIASRRHFKDPYLENLHLNKLRSLPRPSPFTLSRYPLITLRSLVAIFDSLLRSVSRPYKTLPSRFARAISSLHTHHTKDTLHLSPTPTHAPTHTTTYPTHTLPPLSKSTSRPHTLSAHAFSTPTAQSTTPSKKTTIPSSSPTLLRKSLFTDSPSSLLSHNLALHQADDFSPSNPPSFPLPTPSPFPGTR